MLAYDYPVLGAFLSFLWFFLWVLWFFLLFRIVLDIFRSQDLSGVGKVGWLILVLVLPYLGVFIYVVARGGSMGRRDLEQAQARDEAFKAYVRSATPAGGSAEELTKLAELKDRGVITDAEFQQQKAKILS